MSEDPTPFPSSKERLREIGSLFFKLGVIAFGGPAAHIAMMQDEVVTRRGWMSDEHFLDMVGATSLIPGPNSTEMAIHCGYHRGGVRGLIVAGLCFLFPATVLTCLLAWLYVKTHQIPQVSAMLFGIKPAVMAVILGAIYKLGAKALKSWQLGVIGALVMGLALYGLNEILVLLLGGLVGLLWLGLAKPKAPGLQSPWWLPLAWVAPWMPLVAAATANPPPVTLLRLFLVFLKVGAVLFGSGYVLIAYLDGELVQQLGWLTKSQLLDAIAIGQLTPGPVLSTSTFIGFQLHGFWGAMLATVGIFLPSFFFVAMLNPLIPKLRGSRLASAFLDAVNISAMGLMVAVVCKMGAQLFVDWKAIAIFGASLLVLLGSKWKVSSLWIVVGGAIVGYPMSLLGP